MSALPPIATDERTSRDVSNVPIPDSCTATKTTSLFDHLIGGSEQCRRDFEAERLGGRKVYDEIELGRLLDRHFARLGPAQNLVDVLSSAAKEVREIWSIRHQPSRHSVFPEAKHSR